MTPPRHIPDDSDDLCLGVSQAVRAATGIEGLKPQGVVAFTITNNFKKKIGQGKRVGRFGDWTALKGWLRFCQDGDSGDKREVIKGMKVIDCFTGRVVKVKKGIDWVVLSYVWSLGGTARGVETQEGEGEKLPETLPGMVIDAMEATVELGFRYLWADQVCIDQRNQEEVRDQVGKMDRIYRGAVVTVVSVSERGGLPGTKAMGRVESEVVELGGGLKCYVAMLEPIVDIQSSVWFTRGWCYQEEMLSRRILYFTETGVLFKCGAMICHEGVVGPETLSEPGAVASPNFISIGGRQNTKSMLDRCLSGHVPTTTPPNLTTARRIIEEFTKKKLTYDIDSLNAATGVLNMFGSLPVPIRFCQGLPTSHTTLSHFDNAVFLDSFCWFHLDQTSTFRRNYLPSWSWAGWNGAISWPRSPVEEAFEYHSQRGYLPDWNGLPAKHDAKVLALSGSCEAIPSLKTNHFHDCRSGGMRCNPSSAKSILLEARSVPAKFFSFRDKDKRTWENLVVHIDDSYPTDYEHYSAHAEFLVETMYPEAQSAPARLQPEELVDRLRAGQLQCLFLSEQFEAFTSVVIHLLVVEGIGDGVAERFDFIRYVLDWDPEDHPEQEYYDVLFSRVGGLPRVKIWLV